jgi:hypothetical protein
MYTFNMQQHLLKKQHHPKSDQRPHISLKQEQKLDGQSTKKGLRRSQNFKPNKKQKGRYKTLN